MARTIHLRLLGPFDARGADAKPLELSGKKVPALIAYLGVESNRTHTRDELATLLWGDTGEERARHNLRQALAKIRRACSSILIADADTLRLNVERCTIDVREFERLVDNDDLDAVKRGLAIYQHDLLEGMTIREPAFEDWLRNARLRLRDRACEAFERLTAALADQGRLDESIELLRRQLTIDPAREQAHLRLMELLASAGRRADALRQYQKCVDALDRELGARPSAETEAAYERMRRDGGQTSPGPTGSPTATATTASAEPPSVAVLPFENLSGEEHRYFADGLAEDVITALARFGSLLVIARESSFTYRDGRKTLQEIGRELKAQFIVRGSVRLSGSRVRLSVQLLDASTGQHVWAERFDREIEDVFSVQDEVTETIVSTLAGRVEAARVARARRMPDERLDAYDSVLRGKAFHHRVTRDDCDRAIEMFERAIARDSDYALAHAWLACGLGQAMQFHPDQTQALLERAEAAAERGRTLDEQESECYRILAQVSLLRRDLGRARSYQERALFLNPNDDRSVCAMGTILTMSGQPEEGEHWIRKAMRINPYHPESVWFHLGRALFHAGRDQEALAALRHVTRPRVRELVYSTAASSRQGDHESTARAVEALRSVMPRFDAADYVESVPYENERDRTALLDALRAAGV